MKKLDAQGHQFSFDSPHFLRYRAPSGKEILFTYGEKLRLRASTWTGELRLRTGYDSVSLAPLSPEQKKEFLLDFFQAWKNHDPDSARKAAFDYVDAQRGFVNIALVCSLIFTLPVAVALLADSHQQFSCTRELEAHAVPGEIQVVKATKKDSRSYKIRMEFTAPNGEVIRAQDLVHTKNEKDIPRALPILYSPERPLCWSLTKDLDSSEVNWAKRRYFSWFTLLFGLFFLTLAVLGLAWSTLRRMRERPFADDVKALFQFS